MKKKSVLQKRITFSIIAIIIYLFGKRLPIPWIVQNTSKEMSGDSSVTLILQILGSGDSTSSVLTLGITPWMSSMIILRMFDLLRKTNKKRQAASVRHKKENILTLIFAMILAYYKTDGLKYAANGIEINVLRLFSMIILVSGVFLTIWLSWENSEKGLGGQTLIIIINIFGSIQGTLYELAVAFSSMKFTLRILVILAITLMTLITIIITLVLEISEMHILVNRVMVNNVYASDNYMAIKVNPAGAMPIMYVMTFLTIPYYLTEFMSQVFPESQGILHIQSVFQINTISGVLFYILLLFFITIGFGFITVNPTDIAETYQNSGTYIPGVRPGAKTEDYLTKSILVLSSFSAAAMVLCTGIPLLIGAVYSIDTRYTMLPLNFMIITGMLQSIFREVSAIRRFDRYEAFL